MKPQPNALDGVVVVDASTVIAGPYASLLFAEYGARVIKIEHPVRGDGARHLGSRTHEKGYWWKFLSQGKECVTCDVSTPEGAAIFTELAAKADVVIENFRPGTLERWNLGYSELSRKNPNLILLRVSGFGQDGPYKDRPGYGTIAEAMSGVAHVSGEPDGPPMLPGFPLADATAGMMGFAASMMALWKRDARQNEPAGTVIDLNLYAPLVYMLGYYYVEAAATGESPRRQGNRQANAPRNAIQCNDGKWLAYSAQSEKVVGGIVRILELDDPKYNDPAVGYLHGAELDAALVKHLSHFDRQEALSLLESNGVPASAIYDMLDLLKDPHILERGEFVEVPDFNEAEPRTITVPGPPVRMEGHSKTPRPTAAAKGQHTEQVLTEVLGYSLDHVANLRERRIV